MDVKFNRKLRSGSSTRRLRYLFLLVLVLIPGMLIPVRLLSDPLKLISWEGRIVEQETGRSIEGAVIVRSWDKEWATPAGTASKLFVVRETVSDQEGKFSILSRPISPSIPLIYETVEKRTIVFKAGYKFLTLENKPSVIRLEKVPTFLEIRKKMTDEAHRNYETDIYETKFFLDLVTKEEEFTENEKARKPVMAFYWRQADGRKQGGPKVTSSMEPNRPRVKDPEGVERWIGLLRHEDPSMRRMAAEALGGMEIDDPKHLEALGVAVKARLGDPREDVRDLEHLADIGAPIVPILFDEAKRGSSDMHYKVTEILMMIRDREAIPLLTAELEGSNPVTRRIASFALIGFDDPRTVKAWIGALRYGEDLQYHATQALMRIGQPAVEALIVTLSDDNARVRADVAHILGYIKDHRAFEALMTATKDKEPDVRRSAAYALGELRDPRAAECLIGLLNDENAEVQRAASGSLSKIQDPRAMVPLIEKLNDRSWETRLSAVEALAAFPEPRVIQALIDTWNDRDREIRMKAADVLVFIGRPAVDPLIATLRHENSYLRWRASWVLGRINDPRSAPELVRLLDDKVSEVKWVAVWALGLLKEPDAMATAVPPLITTLRNEDLGIRKKASDSLQRLTGKFFQEDVSRWETWWERNKESFADQIRTNRRH